MKRARSGNEKPIRSSRRIHVIADAAGRIIATGGSSEPDDRGTTVALRPLAGQTLHEIPLPAELDQHFKGSAADLHRALAQYELRPGAAQSVLLRRSAMAGGGNATTARRR